VQLGISSHLPRQLGAVSMTDQCSR